MKGKRVVILLTVAALLLAGCAGQQATAPDKPAVPAGCEQALVYQIPDFIPNGPMIVRVTAATALSTAAIAGHPEIKGIVALAMPLLYRATLQNNLPAVMAEVQAKFKTPQALDYATPFLVLFDSLHQAGVINNGQVGLTDCDKNILASLFKNIGLDAGADPAAFQ